MRGVADVFAEFPEALVTPLDEVTVSKVGQQEGFVVRKESAIDWFEGFHRSSLQLWYDPDDCQPN